MITSDLIGNEKYTAEQIQRAREYAAGYEQRLLASIETGETVCNDPDAWIAELKDSISKILRGECDGNFTIWQRMNYFLTGECVPFLAPVQNMEEQHEIV